MRHQSSTFYSSRSVLTATISHRLLFFKCTLKEIINGQVNPIAEIKSTSKQTHEYSDYLNLLPGKNMIFFSPQFMALYQFRGIQVVILHLLIDIQNTSGFTPWCLLYYVCEKQESLLPFSLNAPMSLLKKNPKKPTHQNYLNLSVCRIILMLTWGNPIQKCCNESRVGNVKMSLNYQSIANCHALHSTSGVQR